MYNCHLISQVLLTFVASFQKHITEISALMLTPDKHI